MKLWGQISIELEVADYVEAADHQRRLEALLARIREEYPEARLAMRERRERKPSPQVPVLPPELHRLPARRHEHS
jgi:hypothetical protein